MLQDSLIVITPIRNEKLEDLRAALAEIGANPGRNRWIPFADCNTIHYARWAILEPLGDRPAQLVLATDFDLPLEAHLSELVSKGRQGLDRVYECCESYPGSDAAPSIVREYLSKHRVIPEARYQGARHCTRPQIEAEARLRERVQAFVDRQLAQDGNGGLDPAALASSVMRFVEDDAKLRAMLAPPETPGLAHRLWNVATATGRLLREAPRLGVLLPLVPLLLLDEQRRANAWTPEDQSLVDAKAKRHLENEDQKLQNQMTFLTEVRTDIWPRFLWEWTLRVVLAWIDFRCRVWDVKGRLGRGLRNGDTSGVPTIHFCQWLMIDEGRRLLFLTNYDGSFERYLDDFMDFNGPGVNGLWGSSRGYPPTRGLFWLGKATSRQIKAFFRGHQIETAVWYSAYPDLTVTNINQTSGWRRKLASAGNGESATAVLGGL